MLLKPISSKELADALGLEHFGEAQLIQNISTLRSPKRNSLFFSKEGFLSPSVSSTCIAQKDIENAPGESSLIVSDNPRMDFIRSTNYLLENGFIKPKFHDNHRGDDIYIHSTAQIEEGCYIGDRTSIAAGAIVKMGTHIGNDCFIHENAVVGAEGFGFERNQNGHPIHFTHLGGVQIGDNVYVGACSVISKGALMDTKIADHSKINARVLVGHNVQVGRSTYLHAGVVVSGGCEIGEACWIGTNATVLEKRVVGHNCIIGSGAVVTKNVLPNSVSVGNPAVKIRDNS